MPEGVVREIESWAEREQRTPAEEALSLLREALERKRSAAPSSSHGAPDTVREILDRLSRNCFRPDPEGPGVVEMLREDRNR